MVEPSKLTGMMLGGYHLEQCIERSEQGSVFMARSEAGGKTTTYRLRVLALPDDLAAEARLVYLGRFQQEANQVTTLQNTYILPLLDYGNHQGMPYLVYPHLSTTSLSGLLSKKGPVDVATASRYLDQITAALEYAHEHGALHRNLTTDSVLLKRDGSVLLADFGVMRMLELSREDAQRNLLYGRDPASSPAPEQILGKPVDSYTDVYALGGVLYRILTGHRVFRGSGREALIQQHLHDPVPSLRTWRSDIPPQVDSLIAKAMAKEPLQRFRHPGEFANAYHQVVAPHDKARKPFVIASSPAPAQRPLAVETLPMVRARPHSAQGQPAVSRRRAMTLIGAGVGTAVAIGAVAVFASHYLIGTTSPAASTSPASTAGNTQANAAPTQENTSSTKATQPPAPSGRVLARAADVPPNSAKTFSIPNSQNPGLLIHLLNGSFVAFDSTCTHAGCPVAYNPASKLLECPCHGASFDPSRGAAVVNGPATTPLAKINIVESPDGTIRETS